MTLAPPVSSGVTAVLDRIAEIAARFDPPAAVTSSSTAADLAASISGDGTSSFDSVLEGLLGPAATWTSRGATGATGSAIVEGSKQYLGVPYKWGGTDPSTGLDCSGFVQQAYEDAGITLPRTSRQQATVGVEVPSLEQAKPGDLVTFGQPVDHIGIYVGDNRMIVAPHTGDVVKIQEITRPVANIRRVVDDSGRLVGTGASRTSTSTAAASSRLALSARLGQLGSSADVASSSPLPGTVPYADMFNAAGAKYRLDPKLLAAVAKAESGFNAAAVSRAGAQGLMQFMPATARGMGIDPTDPAQAIDGAGKYLRTQLDRFGSVELALAAYNAGPGAVARAGGIPQNSETRAYVPKVLSIMRGGNW